MAQSRIKWKQTDYLQLGKAVKEFNRKIDKLQALEEKSYLPSKIDYQDAKENIATRSELNRILKSLRRFKTEGAEELYTTKAGEEITRWERNELAIQTRIASSRLNRELKALNKPLESGFSRAQMGSQRVKEIQAQLNNLKQIENKKGYEFERLKNRIHNFGTSDYLMRKANIYQQNYYEMIKVYSNFENYDKFIKELNKHQNPIEFYEFLSKNEKLKDITFMYDNMSNLGIFGTNDEASFNLLLEDIGIEIE